MSVAMIGPKFYGFGSDGKPLAFGKLYTYQARTNSPKDTYQSEDQVVANTNPVILNGEGYANVYLDGSYKMVLKDDNDNEIWSADPVTASQPSEWVNCHSATYVSSTSFKIGGNVTAEYEVGRRIRIDNNAPSYSYSTIQSSSYVSGETVVVVVDSVVTTGVIGACVSIVGPESLSVSNSVLYFDDVEEAINSARLSVFGGQVLNIGGYDNKGDSGKAVWDTVLVGSVSDNGVNKRACVGVPEIAIVRRETVDIKPKVSFIFDDAYQSAKDVLKPLFDSRGYKFGMAIPGANLTSLSRIDYNDMLDMVADGYEVINHAFTGDAPSTTTYGLMKFIGEVSTPQTRFNRSGVNVVGFVTPNSKLNEIYKDSLAQMLSYGFTEFAATAPMLRGVSPYNLHRFNMEAETEQINIDAVDDVMKLGGTIVFYAHDVSVSDAQYDKIVAIMDRAEELGVDIVGPTESIKNITELKEPLLKYVKGDLISNDPNIYSSADAAIVVNNVSDLNITITPASLIRVEATIDLPSEFIGGELLTFCSTLRSVSGSFGDASAIGIELKDSGDTIEISQELSGAELNTNTARYNISAITLSSTVKVTCYMLIDCAQAGSVALMRNPLLRLGNDVEKEKFTGLAKVIGITSNTIPSGTITQGSLQTVALTDALDNGRFSITSNVLTITQDWVGSIHGTLIGNGGQSVDGGYISWSIGGTTENGGLGGTACISPWTDAEQPNACASISANFKTGQTLKLQAFARLVDINYSSNTSRITSL